MCRKSEKGAAEWKGSEAAEKQCKQACEEAWKIKENPRTKREKRLRRRSENSKKLGNRSKWKGWPKEKEPLDKGDGLATAAGARRNAEVTTRRHVSVAQNLRKITL